MQNPINRNNIFPYLIIFKMIKHFILFFYLNNLPTLTHLKTKIADYFHTSPSTRI